MMQAATHTLLWFRPLSPLNYALPESLAQLAWAGTRHIPIDILQACDVSEADKNVLQTSSTWLLSSPTVAHLAAKLGQPSSIAVMGAPTQTAWRDARGAEPAHWFVSPTGESMGLLSALVKYSSVCVLRAAHGRNDLIHALGSKGVTVRTVPMYDKVQHPAFVADLAKAIDNKATHSTSVSLYFSSNDQVARVLAAVQQPANLLASPVFVSHERIAATAHAHGFQNIQKI